MKKVSVVFTILAAAAMLLSACGAPTAVVPPTQVQAQPTEAVPVLVPTAPPPTEAPKLTVGEVTDMGGVDDKSFNASAWKGVQDAIASLPVDGKYLESAQQSDYA